MVSEEEMQNEIDKATSALTICHYIDWFAELQKIKYSRNREKELDNALKIKEEVLKIWNVDLSELKEAGKKLYDDNTCSNILPKSLDEEDMEIPPNLLPNMIAWMRKKEYQMQKSTITQNIHAKGEKADDEI
jgi:hypothetical protein